MLCVGQILARVYVLQHEIIVVFKRLLRLLLRNVVVLIYLELKLVYHYLCLLLRGLYHLLGFVSFLEKRDEELLLLELNRRGDFEERHRGLSWPIVSG